MVLFGLIEATSNFSVASGALVRDWPEAVIAIRTTAIATAAAEGAAMPDVASNDRLDRLSISCSSWASRPTRRWASPYYGDSRII
jgi:hypothetical protein